MINHNIVENGAYTVISYNPAGQVISRSTGFTPRSHDIVSNFQTANGNKKAPNNHKFDSYFISTWLGTSTFYANALPYKDLYKANEAQGWGGNRLDARLQLPTWEVTPQYNRALSKLYDKVRGQLDLSIAVAESHQTVRLLNALKQMKTH